jgi:Flp pilus assembly protein TadD
VQTIYSTPDPQTALDLLQKYHVDYVYVGQAERSYYDPAGLPKWDKMVGSTLDVAYKNPGVRIYRVRAVRVPPAAVAPVSPPSAEDPALQALEAEHQARPADGPTAVGLATAYLQAGRREEAAKVLQDAAPGNPRDVPLHHLLGDVEAQLGHADLAIAAWQAAVAANPSAGNIAKLGTGLVQLGRFDEAERVLRQAQQRDPKDPLIHFYLAEMAHKRKGPNDTELARQEYKTYLDQAPQDSPYRATAEQALKDLGR